MSVDNDLPDRADSPFAAFYADAYPRMARLAYLLCGNAALAEDLVQEAFTQLHDRFTDLDEPTGYLRVTVVNLVRRHHRTIAREQRRLRIVGPADQATVLEASEMLDVLARLPHDQRELIILRFWADLSESALIGVTVLAMGGDSASTTLASQPTLGTVGIPG